jgi:hypothetical protein
MSKEHLRNDNECANCGYTVDVAYCSKCGQKNTETRQPFHHLFTHFIEDLTHYDGAFWKTIKHLLFRPGRLTIEYLQGKRQTYVPPVKLYIFISFITFFIISLLAATEAEEDQDEAFATVKSSEGKVINGRLFHSVAEWERYQDSLPEDKKIATIPYFTNKASLNAIEQDVTNKELIDGIIKMLPKVLFIYMPIFAFWLWLFHGKKRWYFFDHGIFTLHYFAFLLISITLFLLIATIIELINNEDVVELISLIIGLMIMFYTFFYFFRSHSRMYGENRWISRLKSLMLFFINMFCIMLVISISLFYVLLTIH